MALTATQYSPTFAQLVSDLERLNTELETWFETMADNHPNYDHTANQTTLANFKSSYESMLETLQAQV